MKKLLICMMIVMLFSGCSSADKPSDPQEISPPDSSSEAVSEPTDPELLDFEKNKMQNAQNLPEIVETQRTQIREYLAKNIPEKYQSAEKYTADVVLITESTFEMVLSLDMQSDDPETAKSETASLLTALENIPGEVENYTFVFSNGDKRVCVVSKLKDETQYTLTADGVSEKF